MGGIEIRRYQMLVLGMLESLDLYADLAFPVLAEACDAELTVRWEHYWEGTPNIGRVMVWMLERYRFWGVALTFAAVYLALCGVLGLVIMAVNVCRRRAL